MIIGVLQEKVTHVCWVPITVKKLINQNHQIIFEKDCGTKAFITDQNYIEAGAILKSREEILKTSDIICTYTPLDLDELRLMKSNAIYISLFKPYEKESQKNIESYNGLPLYLFSLDMIPRTTIAQSMDVLSSIGSIAGYKAIIEAAHLIPRYFPMLITAAGSVKPAQVLVIGVGVSGLQAIATAKRLGAVVKAMDTREVASEEAKSLGASFLKIEGAKDDKTAGGYAIEQTEEFLKNQRKIVTDQCEKSDVVICTAQVRGKKAPILVGKEAVEKMKNGSVIVDLAAFSGGNCELTQNQKLINHKGVWIYGNSEIALDMPLDNSTLFSNNLYNFINLFINKNEMKIDFDNEIIKSSCIYKPQIN